MTWRSIIDECTKKSLDPRYPGSGKNPGVGFALGVLLGAIGVGLYLRSLKDGLLSFAAAIVLCMILPDAWFRNVACWILCGCWAAMRARASTRRYQESLLACASDPTPDKPEGNATAASSELFESETTATNT